MEGFLSPHFFAKPQLYLIWGSKYCNQVYGEFGCLKDWPPMESKLRVCLLGEIGNITPKKYRIYGSIPNISKPHLHGHSQSSPQKNNHNIIKDAADVDLFRLLKWTLSSSNKFMSKLHKKGVFMDRASARSILMFGFNSADF